MAGCVMLEAPKIVDDGTGWSRIGDLIWSSWNLEAKMNDSRLWAGGLLRAPSDKQVT